MKTDLFIACHQYVMAMVTNDWQLHLRVKLALLRYAVKYKGL